MDTSVDAILALADWRRCVAELYAAARADSEPERAWRRWRDGRRELFAIHPQSPIPADERASYAGPFLFDHDPEARVMATLRSVAQVRVQLGNSDGAFTPFVRFAMAEFELRGVEVALEAYWLEAYGGGVYIAFRDETSGAETYGGGRYLIDSVKGADLGEDDGRLVLDFNFAYQPSCSYDPAWSCPLPPPANRIPLAVTAGERLG